MQVPQLTVPPQPSSTVPQVSPWGQVVSGVQTHTLLVQVPEVQVPQLMVPAQPFEIVPQLSPAGQVVSGVQTQTLAVQV
jgi:hypothetical protein